MTTVTVKLPGSAKAKLSAFVKELGGEIVSKPSKKDAKKAKLLNEIREGLREVKLIREGKAKAYSIADIFDGE